MDTKVFLGILHIIGVAIGVGGATISDIFFVRILKSKKLTENDYKNLKLFSHIIWAGIILLIVSGIGYLWRMYDANGSLGIMQSDKFQAKLTLVGILVANGLVFRYKVFPNFEKVVKGKESLLGISKMLAISGTISVSGWYGVVVLAMLRRDVMVTYIMWMLIYVGLVIVGFTVSYRLIQYILTKNS